MSITSSYADTFSRRLRAILTLAILALPLAATPVDASGLDESKSQPEPVAEAGSLSAVEPTFDFGSLVKGETATHEFVLRNSSDEPVEVRGVAPSCGCTVAEFDRVIPSGGEGAVRVELDTSTLSGEGSSTVEVFVEGQATPAAVLTLQYDVTSRLFAHPGYARWIFVQHEREGTISQTVYSSDGASFNIVSVEAPMPAIEVTFREAKPEERQAQAAGSQWIVAATLDSEAPVGPIEGFLAIQTNHPLQKEMRLPVSGFVRPALFVEPPKADYGTLRLQKPRHTTFSVRNFASDPIKVLSAEADVPGVSARLEPVEEGRRYKVIVILDPAAMNEGPFSGELRLTTDSEKVPQVTVDLSGTLVRPEDKAASSG